MTSSFSYALLTGLFGFILLRIVCQFIDKAMSNHVHTHLQMIINKIVWYAGLVLLCATILSQLGFNLTALLGAAGIAGAAIGFASTTSVSNIISGLFMLLESSFKVGDEISISPSTKETCTGKVESIDLLAVKLRTPENDLIRIPHELIIKSPITIKK